MKRLLCILLLAVVGVARADDLGEANRLLQAKAYDKAFPIYQKLAEAGNPEAQLRLGEMYWFGDATQPDLDKARMWFERSAKAGNADAAASLASLKRRETHGDEIVYWTTKYQGEDMISGQYECKRPELPAVSKTKAEIKATSEQIEAWHACYNRFVANMNDALPPGKRIPAETLDMMTPAEGAQAQRHLDQVYSRLIAQAKANAAEFNAQEAAWRKGTETYVTTEAQRAEDEKNEHLLNRQLMNEWSTQKQMSAPRPPQKR
jgi:TPR repeat protein